MNQRVTGVLWLALAAGLCPGVVAQPVEEAQPVRPAAPPGVEPVTTERPDGVTETVEGAAGEPAGGEQEQPAGASGVGSGGNPGAAPEVGPDEVALSAFSEPVELTALVDFVAKELDINVSVKSGLSGSVVFNAPVVVKRDRLLPLLDALLGQQNYTITLDPSGFYTVQPVQDVIVNPGSDTTTRIISTPGMRPSTLRTALESQFGGSTSGGRTFAYIDDLGVIIATDTPRRLESLEALVASLLAERGRIKFTRVPLVNIAAPVARQRVLELVGQSSGRSGMMNPGGEGVPSPAASDPTKISNLAERLIVDAQGNALILRGTDEELGHVREIVAVIDVTNTLVPRNYFAGTYARQIADMARQRGLGEVTTLSSGEQDQFSPYGGEFNFPNASGGAFGQRTLEGGPVMVVDEGRGTIVYYATEAQHTQLEALIKTLDTESDRIEVKAYKIRHNDAEEVAELINALLTGSMPTGDSPLLQGTGTGNTNRRNRRANQTEPDASTSTVIFAGPGMSAQGGGDGGLSFTGGEDITAIPDKANNQVIIMAPVKQQPEFAKLIEALDLRRPQVYIECKIVAVTASDQFRLAFETQLRQAGGDFALNTNFGLGNITAANGFQSPKAVETDLSGLTAAIIKSANVPLIINALQTVADTQILSTPAILVDDNEEAQIASVDQQPTTSSSQGTSTTQTSFAGYEDAGTDLTVTPQISEGGYLRLKYEAKLSSFTGAGSDGIPPPRQENTVRADSVTVPSDMTVVVGGLTVSTKRKTIVKIPLLGDIPILGQLFRDDNRDSRSTTLYIFLTPRILRDSNFQDLRLLTRGPQERTKSPEDFPEMKPGIIPFVGGGEKPDELPAGASEFDPVPKDSSASARDARPGK